MRLSLGVVLAVCLAGLQFVAVLLVVMSSYLTSERALLEHARELLSDVATNTMEHSKGFLQPARGAAELATRLAENQIVASDNPGLLEKLLFQQLQTAPQFAGVFYGDEKGHFVYVMRSDKDAPFRSKIVNRDGDARDTTLIWRDAEYNVVDQRADPADTYDPRTRPWYRGARDDRQLTWTDPYIFFSSQEPGITVASPVFGPDQEVVGVIGVDIEIDAISGFLSELDIGESGKALILNRNGDVIAHPDPELIKTATQDGAQRFLSIDELMDPIARTAFSGLLASGEIAIDDEISSTFIYENANYVSTLKPIDNDRLPWTIAVYAPEDDFIAGIKTNRTLNIGIAAAVAALTAGLGLVLAGRIHKPVRILAQRATRIAQGDYSPTEPFPKTFRELESANETMMREVARRRKSERDYHQTFDQSSRGMAEISPDSGRFLQVNKRLCDISGYSAEELLQMSLTDICGPDGNGTTMAQALSGGAEHVLERQCKRKDGAPLWLMLNAIMIHDENGWPQHTVVTVDDITETKEAEAQVQRLSNEMAHQNRLNTLGEMAAGLAHEINQPLAAITQNVDAALSTAAGDPTIPPDLTEILTELDEQAHRAGGIVRALRGFVRKGEPSKGAIDLRDLIQQTVRLVKAEAKEHGVEIRVRSVDVPQIIGVRVQVAQVLVNLLRNAIESIAETKGDNRREVIVAASRASTGEVHLCVEDTGRGITAPFDPFAKFETTKADGMGLGLSISRGIMEAHGGRLWHQLSDCNRTTFCCSFKAGGAQ